MVAQSAAVLFYIIKKYIGSKLEDLHARGCAELSANTPLLADTVLPQVLPDP